MKSRKFDLKKIIKTFSIGVALLFVSAAVIGIPVPSWPVPESPLNFANNPSQLCIGWNPEDNHWGLDFNNCPVDYAYYSIDDPAGIRGPGKYLIATGVCCPLPSDDILTKEHVYVTEECPENYVATGAKNNHCGVECEKQIRCTKINSERYTLGNTTPSRYWGNGYAGWQGSTRVKWGEIPAGMRYSVGRAGLQEWDVDGCVGYPYGSLFVKKESKYCAGMFFKQLQYAGLAGDPKAGTPVRMFPECKQVNNLGDPDQVSCIN